MSFQAKVDEIVQGALKEQDAVVLAKSLSTQSEIDELLDRLKVDFPRE